VTLSAPVESGVTLTVNSATGTASGADFTAMVGATLSFAANSTTSQTVDVAITNDALDEDDEQFTLTLSDLSATGNVTLGAATATGTIVDDDALPLLTISSPSQPEGDSGTTPMNFVVTLTPVSGRDVSFTRVTADGTATVVNNDYLPLTVASLTIPAGSTTVSIPVQIVGDTTFEGNENFSLNLGSVVNASIVGAPLIEGIPTVLTGTGTIEEDDSQPTTTSVDSSTLSATVVGEAYTVAVTVTAQTTSPLGTVTIRDGGPGSPSCVATLSAGTAPASSGSCALTSNSAGTKTLSADYTPANTEYQPSSGSASHPVTAASTAISVVGPARSRVNQPTSFSFALSVDAPGAGSPAGTVTLSSGASSCSVTVPTATPSCTLSFASLGARSVNASFVASDGNFAGSSSSGAGNAQTLVYALSDIAVTKTDGIAVYRPDDLLVYTVTVRNLGPDTAENLRVIDIIPAGLINVVWSCDASGGAICPQTGGSGNLDLIIPSFINGALLNFTFFGNVQSSTATISNTASVELPADTTVEDPVLGNNSATDTNVADELFANGFEDAMVNAASGSYRLPSLALRGVLDEVAVVVLRLDDARGEALRVYARVFAGQVQYALALRGNDQLLHLGAWHSFDGEPTLSWSAAPQQDTWVLQSAELH
jgi:uncharacterized repeat protein (TIGR01451 family)